jgi:hypothetical protein
MAAGPLAGSGRIVPENSYYQKIINSHFNIPLCDLLLQQHSSSNACCQRRLARAPRRRRLIQTRPFKSIIYMDFQ